MTVKKIAGRAPSAGPRKRAEEELNKLCSLVPGMIYQFTRKPDGTYCVPFTTEAIREIFGCSPQDVRDDFSPIARVILPEDFDRVVGSIEYSAEHLTVWSCEYRVLVPGRPVRWILGHSTPVKSADGSITWYGFNTDFTERKRMEDLLKASEKRFQDIAGNAQEWIWEVDAAGTYTYASPTVEKILGYTPEEILHKAFYDLFLPEDQEELKAAALTAFALKLPFREFINRNVHKNGQIIWLATSGLPLLDDEGNLLGYRGADADITERKRAEAQREAALEEVARKARELQEKNAELTRFTHAVSHDLRSPLVTVKTFLGHLEDDLRNRDQVRVGEDLGFIRAATDKMGRLLDELLRLSRVGRIINPAVEVPLSTVVREALDISAGRIAERDVRVEVTDEPVILFGDQARLVEIFHNLVDNAVKFMGVQPAPRVEIGAEESGGELILFVRDNGAGLDPNFSPRLFGLFEKFDPASDGVGLGLALVRRIVELHGGRIWADSEGPGRGTTFRFTLMKTRRPEGRKDSE